MGAQEVFLLVFGMVFGVAGCIVIDPCRWGFDIAQRGRGLAKQFILITDSALGSKVRRGSLAALRIA